MENLLNKKYKTIKNYIYGILYINYNLVILTIY